MTFELYVREPCDATFGGLNCITGTDHGSGSHYRRIRNDDLRDALDTVVHTAGVMARNRMDKDPLEILREELR